MQFTMREPIQCPFPKVFPSQLEKENLFFMQLAYNEAINAWNDDEVPVGAVLDWIETRDDLDSSKTGIWGVSLGGYYAPRAAAHHDRLKACISLTGPFNWAEAWESLPDLTRAAFVARSHSASQKEAKDKAHCPFHHC